MANFFGKPKPQIASGSESQAGSAIKAGGVDVEMKVQQEANVIPDFERAFKPFVLKKDAELAPGNWFHDVCRNENQLTETEIIIVEDEELSHPAAAADEDVVMHDASHSHNDIDRGQMTAQGIVATLVE
jgi:chromatin assembly factor 1 subunit A